MQDCLSRKGRKGNAMTPEMVTTLVAAASMFVALSGLIVSLFLWLRADIKALDAKVADLGERVAHLGERVARVEGKLEFLEHYITRQNEPPPAPAE